MSDFVDATLGLNEETAAFMLVGHCDIWISGLTSGDVKLQVLFPNEVAYRDVPSGSFSADTFKNFFISEHGVKAKLVGVSNNAGVYVRMGRFLNRP